MGLERDAATDMVCWKGHMDKWFECGKNEKSLDLKQIKGYEDVARDGEMALRKHQITKD